MPSRTSTAAPSTRSGCAATLAHGSAVASLTVMVNVPFNRRPTGAELEMLFVSLPEHPARAAAASAAAANVQVNGVRRITSGW